MTVLNLHNTFIVFIVLWHIDLLYDVHDYQILVRKNSNTTADLWFIAARHRYVIKHSLRCMHTVA